MAKDVEENEKLTFKKTTTNLFQNLNCDKNSFKFITCFLKASLWLKQNNVPKPSLF
jgi:hypothetical protein